MIPSVLGVWAAGTAAAGPDIDLLIAPVTAHTHTLSVRHERLDPVGQTITRRHRPASKGLGYRGLYGELLWDLPRLDGAAAVTSIGFNLARPQYESPTFDFAPDLGEVELGFGLKVSFDEHNDALIDGYAIGLTGVQLAYLSARPWTRLAVSPMPFVAFGIGMNTQNEGIRFRSEVRADLGVSFEHVDARLELPHGAMTWGWWPVSASLSLLVGLGF